MEIITKKFHNQATQILVDFFESNGLYLNATKVATAFGKDLSNWRRSPQTIEYIEAILSSVLYTELTEKDLFIVILGKGKEQGTWIHRKLIIAFARWLSPNFAVWCDWTIEEILKSKQQTPETVHQTVQVQNETLDLDFYTQQSEKIFKLVQLINSQNIKTLYFADNLYKNLNIKSLLELLNIDLLNYYFIPTELGNFINASPVETNKVLEFKGLQTKQNGIWVLTEKGRNFAIEVQNGSFLQIKWKIKAIFE